MTCVYVCMHVYLYRYEHVCLYICSCVFMHVCVCVCVFVGAVLNFQILDHYVPSEAFLLHTVSQSLFLCQVAYSDVSPYLVLTEASLEDLNSRLEKKVKTINFRPNIVISGCDVFAEVTFGLRSFFLFILWKV